MDILRSKIPRMGKKATYILFALIVILATLNALAVYLFTELFKKDLVKEAVQRIIMSNYFYLTPKDHDIVSQIVKNSDTAGELTRNFHSWDTYSSQFSNVCQFGTRVLQHYAIYADNQHLDAVVKIINAINTKVLATANLDGTGSTWNFDDLSEDCARFLVAYQYLGNHRYDESTNAICFNFIMKLVPELNKINNPDDSKLIRGNSARLLSLYLNDSSQYKSDVASKEMENFKEVLKRLRKQKGSSRMSYYNYYMDIFSVFKFWKE